MANYWKLASPLTIFSVNASTTGYLIRTSNGTLYAIVAVTTKPLKVYKSTNNGVTWTITPDYPNAPPTALYTTNNVSAAIDGAGIIHIVTTLYVETTLYYITYNTNTDTFGSPQAIIQPISTDNISSLAIALDSNGNSHIVASFLTASDQANYINNVSGDWSKLVEFESGTPLFDFGINFINNIPIVSGQYTALYVFRGNNNNATAFSAAASSEINATQGDVTAGQASIPIVDSHNTVWLASNAAGTNGQGATEVVLYKNLSTSATNSWQSFHSGYNGFSQSITIIGTQIYVFYQRAFGGIAYNQFDTVSQVWGGEIIIIPATKSFIPQHPHVKYQPYFNYDQNGSLFGQNNQSSNRIDFLFDDGTTIYYSYVDTGQISTNYFNISYQAPPASFTTSTSTSISSTSSSISTTQSTSTSVSSTSSSISTTQSTSTSQSSTSSSISTTQSTSTSQSSTSSSISTTQSTSTSISSTSSSTSTSTTQSTSTSISSTSSSISTTQSTSTSQSSTSSSISTTHSTSTSISSTSSSISTTQSTSTSISSTSSSTSTTQSTSTSISSTSSSISTTQSTSTSVSSTSSSTSTTQSTSTSQSSTSNSTSTTQSTSTSQSSTSSSISTTQSTSTSQSSTSSSTSTSATGTTISTSTSQSSTSSSISTSMSTSVSSTSSSISTTLSTSTSISSTSSSTSISTSTSQSSTSSSTSTSHTTSTSISSTSSSTSLTTSTSLSSTSSSTSQSTSTSLSSTSTSISSTSSSTSTLPVSYIDYGFKPFGNVFPPHYGPSSINNSPVPGEVRRRFN